MWSKRDHRGRTRGVAAAVLGKRLAEMMGDKPPRVVAAGPRCQLAERRIQGLLQMSCCRSVGNPGRSDNVP